MLICKEKNFGFYHMAKCGGISIINMLQSLPLKWEQIGKKHIPISRKEYDFSGLVLFANIRNPFHRIVSVYEYFRQASQVHRFEKIDFRAFFYDWYMDPKVLYPDFCRPIHEQLFVDGKLPDNMAIVQVEEANRIWPDIVRTFLDAEVTVPKDNTTKHGDPMEYFDKAMKQEVTKKEWWACGEYRI